MCTVGVQAVHLSTGIVVGARPIPASTDNCNPRCEPGKILIAIYLYYPPPRPVTSQAKLPPHNLTFHTQTE